MYIIYKTRRKTRQGFRARDPPPPRVARHTTGGVACVVSSRGDSETRGSLCAKLVALRRARGRVKEARNVGWPRRIRLLGSEGWPCRMGSVVWYDASVERAASQVRVL